MRGHMIVWQNFNSGRTSSSLLVSAVLLSPVRGLFWRTQPGALTRRLHLKASPNLAWPRTESPTSQSSPGAAESGDDVGTVSGRKPKDNTLTESERAIFQHIYQDAAERRAQHHLSEEGRIERLIGDTSQTQTSDEPLSTIFDRARDVIERNQSTRKRLLSPLDAHRRPEADPRRVPPELLQSVPILRVHDTLSGPELPVQIPSSARQSLPRGPGQSPPGAESNRDQTALSNETDTSSSVELSKRDSSTLEACSKDATRVDGLLQKAERDTEIWQILQKEVFAKVELFLKKMQTELERVGDDPSVSSASSSSSMSSPFKKKRGRQGKAAASEQPSMRALSLATSPDKYPQLAVPFAVIRANYAHHCWAALRILRVRFPRSPYATAVLPTVKALGPISYVLGASTALYNELLFLRWAHYRDLQACADLLAEMLNRGIPTNAGTRAVFRDAARRWLAARRQQQPSEGLGKQRENTAGREHGASLSPSASSLDDGLDSTHHQHGNGHGHGHGDVRPFELAWWALEGVQSGFKRWEGLEVEARRRHEEEAERRNRALQDDADEEDGDGEEGGGGEKPTLGLDG